MVRPKLIAALLAILILAGAPASGMDSRIQDQPAKRIADFTLTDYLGAKRSLSEWKDRKVVVVVFLGVECPLAKLYASRLAELDKQYADEGIQLIGINSNQQDTLQEIAAYAKRHGVEFPLLKDPGAKIADLFEATRTPEAFVLDADRVIQYRGRIDDQYGVGSARNSPTRSDLVEAIKAVLAGNAPPVASTDAVGCLIGRRRPGEAAGDITYTRHIVPILQDRCVNCHRPGQIAPFTLTDYDDVVAWADTMLEVIDDGRMPPWHANPAHGEFYNDARMTNKEKETFRNWVANGTPKGDPADSPPPREYPDGWQLTEPYTVFRMPEAYQVPATGTVPYQYFYMDPGFKEDKWVCAAEARPGNPEVVHHLFLFYLPPGQETHQPKDPLINAVAAFAPGMPAIVGPEEYAVRIPAGSKLVFQVHYTPNGSATTDRSEAALVFADPAKVAKEVRIRAGLNFKFLIPPGAKDYPVRTERVIDRDSLLYTLTPHMHYRGKSFRFTARYPDGRSEILLDVPRYDFNWQLVYLLKKPKLLPAGTVIDMEAHYDNSADNPLNPDPNQVVYWGDQTWDEMMLGSMTISDAHQDLRLGPPRITPVKPAATADDLNSATAEQFVVHFRYRPPANSPQPPEDVFVAGTFNDWKPNELKMAGPDEEGFYTKDLTLPAGRIEYKFVVNGQDWRTDPGNRNTAGDYGNSVLVVK